MIRHALSSLLLATAILAQLEPEYTTITATGQTTSVAVPNSYLRPTGVARGAYSFGSTVPMMCHSVCYPKQYYYGLCILGVQLQDGQTNDAVEIPQGQCLDELCGEGAYNHIYECLNCIVANGGESTGSSTSGSFSSIPAPVSTSSSRFADPTEPQWPSVDAEAANGWLSNITEYCREGGREVQGETSVTASPTTTGPYTTRYSASQTIDIPQWTQLATLSQMISDYDASDREAYYAQVTERLAAQASQTGAAGKLAVSVGLTVVWAGLLAAMGVLA